MVRPEAGIAAAAAMAALPDVLPDHAVSRRASRWLAPGAGEGVMTRAGLDFLGVRISRLSVFRNRDTKINGAIGI